MRHNQTPIALLVSIAVAVACSDAVGPEERRLDGPWSTGHALIGVSPGRELGMALNLSWTRDGVTGSGGYSAPDPAIRCGTASIAGQGTAVFAAMRPSRTEIRGQLTFGEGPPIAYQGTLIDTQSVAGFARVQGVLLAPDGTECGLTLLQGLVP
jgi:hypothetical protein